MASRQRKRQHKPSWETDVPNHKSLLLRWPFLAVLFILNAGLLVLLEVALHILPHEQARRAVPEVEPTPTLTKRSVHSSSRPQDKPASTPPAAAYARREAVLGVALTTTESPATLSAQRRSIKAPEPEPDARPPEPSYIKDGMGDIFISNSPQPSASSPTSTVTFVTWADRWYGDPGNRSQHPYDRTPLFPEDDASGKCVYRYKGIVMSDTTGCLAIIGDKPRLSGWKWASWVASYRTSSNGLTSYNFLPTWKEHAHSIWVEEKGPCDTGFHGWMPEQGQPAMVSPRSLDLDARGIQLGFLSDRPDDWSGLEASMVGLKQIWDHCEWVQGAITRRRGFTQSGPSNEYTTLELYTGFWMAGESPQSSAGTLELQIDSGLPRTVPWNKVTLEPPPMVRQRNEWLKPLAQLPMDRKIPDIDAAWPLFGNFRIFEEGSTLRPCVLASSENGSDKRYMRLWSPRGELDVSWWPQGHIEVTQFNNLPNNIGDIIIKQQTGASPAEVGRSTARDSSAPSQLSPVTTIKDPPVDMLSTNHVNTPTTTPTAERNTGHIGTGSHDFSTPVTESTDSTGITINSASRLSSVLEEEDAMRKTSSPRLKPWSATVIKGPFTISMVVLSEYSSDNTVFTSTTRSEITTTIVQQIPAILTAPSLTTLIDSEGHPVSTATTFPGGYLITTLTTITLYDADKTPTATATTHVPITSLVKTTTDQAGRTTTMTEYPVFPSITGAAPADLVVAKGASYFVVYFFPVLLAAFLLVPIQAMDAQVKMLLPFRLLTRTDKTISAKESLGMETGGIPGRLAGLRLLFKRGDGLSVLSDIVVLASVVLVALSAETVGLKVQGVCDDRGDSSRCFVTIAAFPGPARAVEGLLVVVMVSMLGLMVVLGRWRSGIAVHPSSLAALCALLQVPQAGLLLERLRGVYLERGGDWDGDGLDKRLGKALEGVGCRLARVGDGTGKRGEDYGIVAVEMSVKKKSTTARPKSKSPKGVKAGGKPIGMTRLRVPTTERILQAAFLCLLCGLLGVLLYYEHAVYRDPAESAFEAFMDSQSFGVRTLFTTLGVIISMSWESYFTTYYHRRTYARMSHVPQPAHLSILSQHPTTIFSGLWHALRHQKDLLSTTAAFAAILSKFLPPLLSSVPFAAVQTWRTHEICIWTAIAILILTILILLAHIFLVKWPAVVILASPPNSLAQAAYYVCDSALLRDFERMSMLSAKERNKRVENMGRRYSFGWISGLPSGQKRVGIEHGVGGQGFMLRSLAPLGLGRGSAGKK